MMPHCPACPGATVAMGRVASSILLPVPASHIWRTMVGVEGGRGAVYTPGNPGMAAQVGIKVPPDRMAGGRVGSAGPAKITLCPEPSPPVVALMVRVVGRKYTPEDKWTVTVEGRTPLDLEAAMAERAG